jgi:hypothetical protein
VDVAPELFGEEAVNQALAGDATLSGEGGGDDGDVEMAFALGSRAGMAGMTVRFVDDIETRRTQPFAKFGANHVGDAAHWIPKS